MELFSDFPESNAPNSDGVIKMLSKEVEKTLIEREEN